MSEETGRIRQLERQIWLSAAVAVIALAAAAIALFRVPGAGQGSGDPGTPLLAGGASLEMVGQDLRITLPSAYSSIVLQTPTGEEIARFGSTGPRPLGE